MKNVKPLLFILILAVALRLAAAFYLGNDTGNWLGGTADQVSYDNLARRLLGGHGFSFATAWWPATAAGEPTAHWSYLYTGFLALVYAIFGHNPLAARLAQAVLTGLLLPWLTYRIGKRLDGETAGLVAAAFMAVYFYFVIFSAALMTEAFYTVALLWLVDVAQRLGQDSVGNDRYSMGRGIRYGVELGLAMGMALLLRQVGLFVIVAAAGWLLWLAWRQRAVRETLAPLALAGGVTLLLLLPWSIRNYNAFGVVSLWPNTNSGFALFWANHPIYGTQFETVLSPDHGVSYQELIPAELRHLNEAEMDKALRAQGVAIIVDDLPRYARLSLSRIPVHFQFWPTADSSLLANFGRLFSFGLALPLTILGIALFLSRGGIGPLRQRRFWQRGAAWTASDWYAAQGWLLLAITLSYNGLHILTWAKVRYRLPTDAFMFLFAALALVWLWQQWRAQAAGDRQWARFMAVEGRRKN
jgi:4-amino-4-deoxy-L-arabinose transferase-like glycosyltransferase